MKYDREWKLANIWRHVKPIEKTWDSSTCLVLTCFIFYNLILFLWKGMKYMEHFLSFSCSCRVAANVSCLLWYSNNTPSVSSASCFVHYSFSLEQLVINDLYSLFEKPHIPLSLCLTMSFWYFQFMNGFFTWFWWFKVFGIYTVFWVVKHRKLVAFADNEFVRKD